MVIEFFKSTGKSRSESIPILLSPNGRYVAFPINPAYVPGSDSLAKNYNQITMNIYEIKIEDRKLRLILVDQIDWFDEFMKISGGVDTLYDEYEVGTLFMNDNK